MWSERKWFVVILQWGSHAFACDRLLKCGSISLCAVLQPNLCSHSGRSYSEALLRCQTEFQAVTPCFSTHRHLQDFDDL